MKGDKATSTVFVDGFGGTAANHTSDSLVAIGDRSEASFCTCGVFVDFRERGGQILRPVGKLFPVASSTSLILGYVRFLLRAVLTGNAANLGIVIGGWAEEALSANLV